MALATRPKPKAADRKRQAQHHTQGKHYLKTYWPYLPMLAVVAGGVLTNRALYGSTVLSSSAGAVIGGQSSSRIQNLFGNQSSWIFLAALAVTAAAFIVFVVTHWYRLHRLMNKGEAFIIRRPWLEVVTVAVFTFGFILTRSAGLPH